MNAGWIFLAVVAVVILSKLFSVLGKENVKTEKFRGVLPGTGQIVEMTITGKPEKNDKKDPHVFNEEDFLMGAKMAFNAVVDAFASGNKETLKPLVSRKVFDAFFNDIQKREENGEKMEFSLIAINSSKILSKNDEKKPTRVTVELVTEQMNVLRDKDGVVLEGDPIQISLVKDTWTFQKEIGLRSSWIVVATKSEAI